jgi:hypothetical protein
MNVSEELCYWYLRLNGFFPLSRFVMHRTAGRASTSDCDVLAVRPPHVHEEVGGRPDDWDPLLGKELDFTRTIGVISEVKSGRLERAKLFRSAWLSDAVARLGLIGQDESKRVAKALKDAPVLGVGSVQLAKLLVSRVRPQNGCYLWLSLDHLESFVRARIQKYLSRKYGDRMFFDSMLVQQLIAEESASARRKGRR